MGGLNTLDLINTGSIQPMTDVPVVIAAGACATSCALVNQGNPYTYHLLGAAAFYRYNNLTDGWQILASPSGTISFVAGCSLVYDPNYGNMGGVWLFTPKATSAWCIFQVYDIETNTWTDRAVPSGLGSAWGTNSSLAITPTQAHASGDNNAIYLIGNNSTTWYKYSKADNTWEAMATALPAAAGLACKLIWLSGIRPNRLLFIRGAATSAMYEYNIGEGTFESILAYNPASETFTTGTSYAYDFGERVFIQRDATRRLLSLNLRELRCRPIGTIPSPGGTAREGDRMTFVSDGESDWIYVPNNSLAQYFRFEAISATGSD